MNGVLNRQNVEKAHNLADGRGNSSFNCWGGTLYALGKIDVLEWVECDEMTEFLEENTFEIDERHAQEGDILALYNENGELIHTAVYLGMGQFWHKMGGCQAEFTDKEGVFRVYREWGYYSSEFRALKNI